MLLVFLFFGMMTWYYGNLIVLLFVDGFGHVFDDSRGLFFYVNDELKEVEQIVDGVGS